MVYSRGSSSTSNIYGYADGTINNTHLDHDDDDVISAQEFRALMREKYNIPTGVQEVRRPPRIIPDAPSRSYKVVSELIHDLDRYKVSREDPSNWLEWLESLFFNETLTSRRIIEVAVPLMAQLRRLILNQEEERLSKKVYQLICHEINSKLQSNHDLSISAKTDDSGKLHGILTEAIQNLNVYSGSF